MRIGDRFKAELEVCLTPVCGLPHDSSLDLERTAGAVRPAADVLGRTENDEASRNGKPAKPRITRTVMKRMRPPRPSHTLRTHVEEKLVLTQADTLDLTEKAGRARTSSCC